MSSVTSSGVGGGVNQQSNRLALLVKLFQTSGKSAQDSKKDPAQGAAPPPPPPPPPARPNSAAGLASMFEALQSPETGSVSDLLSRLLQAVDTDGDGTISADELQAVTELTVGTGQTGSPLPLTAVGQPDPAPRTRDTTDERQALDLQNRSPGDLTLTGGTAMSQGATAYEALFQALQLVFAPANTGSVTNSGQRYTALLQSLANAG